MISITELYESLYNVNSKFESSLMRNLHIKQVFTYLICELSTLPNGRLVSVISIENNEEYISSMIDRLIILCKYILDRTIRTYSSSNEEYDFIYGVLAKILKIFGIINDDIEVPTIETINCYGQSCTFVSESLTNLNMFALLRGADWINNRRPGDDQIAMINILNSSGKYNGPEFIQILPVKYRILRNVCDEIKQYLHYEHCKISYPNSIYFSLAKTAIEIRKHHIDVKIKLDTDILSKLDELTCNNKYPHDTKVLYLTLWIMNILYYRYGNEEILSKVYIHTAHNLARKSIKRDDSNKISNIIMVSLMVAVILLALILTSLIFTYFSYDI